MTNDTPKIDPDLGVWTPAYAKHALCNLSDSDFQNKYGCDKAKARSVLGLDPEEEIPLSTEESDLQEVIKSKDLIIKELKGVVDQRNNEIKELRDTLASIDNIASAEDDKVTTSDIKEQPEKEKAEPLTPVADKPEVKKAAAKKTAKKKGGK